MLTHDANVTFDASFPDLLIVLSSWHMYPNIQWFIIIAFELASIIIYLLLLFEALEIFGNTSHILSPSLTSSFSLPNDWVNPAMDQQDQQVDPASTSMGSTLSKQRPKLRATHLDKDVILTGTA